VNSNDISHGQTIARLVDELRRSGLRITAQRVAVLETLVDSNDHPSALEVLERVRRHFPTITMATVYNTVNTLAKRGLIQLLSFPGGARYDANPLPHVNLVCVRCQRITDGSAESHAVEQLRDAVADRDGFQVISQRIDFYGVCPQCAAESPGL
jgi:Fur family transcriptional regulator, peroxide stress response regulator